MRRRWTQGLSRGPPRPPGGGHRAAHAAPAHRAGRHAGVVRRAGAHPRCHLGRVRHRGAAKPLCRPRRHRGRPGHGHRRRPRGVQRRRADPEGLHRRGGRRPERARHPCGRHHLRPDRPGGALRGGTRRAPRPHRQSAGQETAPPRPRNSSTRSSGPWTRAPISSTCPSASISPAWSAGGWRQGLEADLATSRALAQYRDNVRFFDRLVELLRARSAQISERPDRRRRRQREPARRSGPITRSRSRRRPPPTGSSPSPHVQTAGAPHERTHGRAVLQHPRGCRRAGRGHLFGPEGRRLHLS